MIDKIEYKNLLEIKKQIINDPLNKTKTDKGIMPLYDVTPNSKILIIGQAPGIKAEEAKQTWKDKSGIELRSWLGVTEDEFYNPNLFGQMPMDFYYPGKAKTGDLPPRKGFAETWHPMILKNLHKVELIILIGSYAQDYYLKDQKTLTERVKDYKSYLPKYFVLSHPSPLNFRWRNKNPWFIEETIPKLKEIIYSILKDK